jgi:hypothetical protein
MAREEQRRRAAARLEDARAALAASPTDGTARVRVEHRAAVLRAELELEHCRIGFGSGG